MSFGGSSQRDRIERARLKLFKRMIDRGGKAKEMIVDNWRFEGKWIREVKNNLEHNGIKEWEIEVMDLKELEKRIKIRKQLEWVKGIEAKRSLRWYGLVCNVAKGERKWLSEEKDRVMKRYWSGVMEYRLGKGEKVCQCGMARIEDWVEHYLNFCERTKWWREQFAITSDDRVEEILINKGEALVNLERWRIE